MSAGRCRCIRATHYVHVIPNRRSRTYSHIFTIFLFFSSLLFWPSVTAVAYISTIYNVHVSFRSPRRSTIKRNGRLISLYFEVFPFSFFHHHQNAHKEGKMDNARLSIHTAEHMHTTHTHHTSRMKWVQKNGTSLLILPCMHTHAHKHYP